MRHTVSSIREWRTCRRRYQYKHVELVRPARSTSALSLGTAVHAGIESFLKSEPVSVDGCEFINDSDRSKARAMVRAYVERWQPGRAEWATVEVEGTFEQRLNGSALLCGKWDALLRHLPTGRLYLVEHKTTSDDPSEVGSDYWQRLAVDLQLTVYQHVAAQKYGEPVALLYDVVRKPSVRLKKDEDAAAYESRCYEQMSAAPDEWLVRREVHRLDEQARVIMAELREDIEAIEKYTGSWPRNDSACTSYGSTCPYLSVCSGTEQLDSERFVKLEAAHPELATASTAVESYSDCPL